MIISKDDNNNRDQLVINGKHIEQVPHYKYLGTLVNGNIQHKEEILAPSQQARVVFIKIKN